MPRGGKRIRQDTVGVLLRMEPEDRERLHAVIPRGQINTVLVDAVMRYVRDVEAHGLLTSEGGRHTAA